VRVDTCSVPIGLAAMWLAGWILTRGWRSGRHGFWTLFDFGMLGLLAMLLAACVFGR
jgi:hypothetical protein